MWTTGSDVFKEGQRGIPPRSGSDESRNWSGVGSSPKCTKLRTKFRKISGMILPDPDHWGVCSRPPGKEGRERRERGGRVGINCPPWLNAWFATDSRSKAADQDFAVSASRHCQERLQRTRVLTYTLQRVRAKLHYTHRCNKRFLRFFIQVTFFTF